GGTELSPEYRVPTRIQFRAPQIACRWLHDPSIVSGALQSRINLDLARRSLSSRVSSRMPGLKSHPPLGFSSAVEAGGKFEWVAGVKSRYASPFSKIAQAAWRWRSRRSD